MELQFRAQLLTGQSAIRQFGENTKLDSGQQDFGRPERKSGLKNGIGR